MIEEVQIAVSKWIDTVGCIVVTYLRSRTHPLQIHILG